MKLRPLLVGTAVFAGSMLTFRLFYRYWRMRAFRLGRNPYRELGMQCTKVIAQFDLDENGVMIPNAVHRVNVYAYVPPLETPSGWRGVLEWLERYIDGY